MGQKDILFLILTFCGLTHRESFLNLVSIDYFFWLIVVLCKELSKEEVQEILAQEHYANNFEAKYSGDT